MEAGFTSLTVRISAQGALWIRSLADTHGASQSAVLRALLAVASTHPDEVDTRLRALTAALDIAPPAPPTKPPAKRPPPKPEPAPEPDWNPPPPDQATSQALAEATPTLAKARKTVDKVEEARKAVKQVTTEQGRKLGHAFRAQPGAPLRCTCGQPLNQH